MRLRRILSLNVFTESLEPMAPFYADGLTLPVGRAAERLLGLYAGETSLNILPAEEDTRALVGRATGITLRVRGEGDLPRFITRLQDKGFECRDQDFSAHRGGHRLIVRDPSGNQLTLCEIPEDRDDLHIFEGPSSVTVGVRDIRRSLGFFLTQLELPMLDQPSARTAVLFPGGTNLILTEGDNWSPAEPIRGETGICLLAEDPASVFDMLRGQRVSFAEPPQEGGGYLAAVINDPDGNRFTIMGPT